MLRNERITFPSKASVYFCSTPSMSSYWFSLYEGSLEERYLDEKYMNEKEKYMSECKCKEENSPKRLQIYPYNNGVSVQVEEGARLPWGTYVFNSKKELLKFIGDEYKDIMAA